MLAAFRSIAIGTGVAVLVFSSIPAPASLGTSQDRETRRAGPDTILGAPQIALLIQTNVPEKARGLASLLGKPLSQDERRRLADSLETIVMGSFTKEGIPVVRFDSEQHNVVATRSSKSVTLRLFVVAAKSDNGRITGEIFASIQEEVALTRQEVAGRTVIVDVFQYNMSFSGSDLRAALYRAERVADVTCLLVIAKYEFKNNG